MKHIGIIGAGISGLATAKAFMQKGYAVSVFEKAASIGGVWEPSRSYARVCTQTTRDEYAFSDFPMPANYPLWPTGAQVQVYLEQYAKTFGIAPYIQFNAQVTDLRFTGKEWSMGVNNLHHNASVSCAFDFVAICTGTFHKPYIPDYAGTQSFIDAGGQILHSSQVKDESILNGKAVAVVGFAKSATDMATLAADLGSSCSLIYRKAQWKVPRYFGKRINMRYLLFSRFSEAFFDAPKKTTFQKILHTVGKPMVWAQWRALEALLKMQFKLKDCDMVPQHRIEDQISCSLGVAPEGFYEKVKEGKIKARRSEIAQLEGRKIILKSGETIHTDILVCGTGFTQQLPFLDETYRNKIVDADGSYGLYRNIIHPDIPQLGFVGYNSSLFSTLTSEVAANWLACYAGGELNLPSSDELKNDISLLRRWRKNSRPVSSEFSGTCIAPFNFMHLDDLMRDMGLPVKISRSPANFFKPISPADYRKLLSHNRKVPVLKKASIPLQKVTA